ncbi:MAG: Cys-tRNA(Pro) deacylase [Planctomycetota bacterium]|jgi:Cys-tRNA(Pro)/Cys-tRNA(Cys) deacylase|nr:Cys-tRNA(Pro) deacylase [Planctomycetota bacterium]
MKTAMTNAARILDQAEIPYQIVHYVVDEGDLGAGHVTAQLGLDPRVVFKTLVLRGDRTGYLVCIVPGEEELDLKKAAKVSGNKSCAMIPMKELQAVTGYPRGGCSPVGMKKRFPTFIHSTALEHPEIHVSAGRRGLQLRIRPGDLIAAAGAGVVDITAWR